MQKRAVILGAGESGTGSAVLAGIKDYDVFVSDSGQIKENYRKLLDDHSIAFEEGEHTKGKILTADVAEGILQNNEADMVAIARPILCDPYWPNKLKAAREKDILKCIYCNECREAEGAFEEVTCIQWKKKDGSVVVPDP